MNRSIIVAPSLLAADLLHLEAELDRIAEAGVEWLHFDVMDGHFVPDISFGAEMLRAIKGNYDFFFDVHIMVSNPLKAASALSAAGADLITFHYEAVDDVRGTIAALRALNPKLKIGISIKPLTQVDDILDYLDLLDLVLVMSVEPGKGGQEFDLEALDKVEQLREYIDESGENCLIEIDGGINAKTGPDSILAGADILVSGTYIFHSSDVREAVRSLGDIDQDE